MNADPRAALQALTSAFERHLEACSGRRGDDDPAVLSAAEALADAFDAYDDALLSAYNEMTPLVVLDEDDYDDDDDDDDDFDDEDYLDDDEDSDDEDSDDEDDNADDDGVQSNDRAGGHRRTPVRGTTSRR